MCAPREGWDTNTASRDHDSMGDRTTSRWRAIAGMIVGLLFAIVGAVLAVLFPVGCTLMSTTVGIYDDRQMAHSYAWMSFALGGFVLAVLYGVVSVAGKTWRYRRSFYSASAAILILALIPPLTQYWSVRRIAHSYVPDVAAYADRHWILLSGRRLIRLDYYEYTRSDLPELYMTFAGPEAVRGSRIDLGFGVDPSGYLTSYPNGGLRITGYRDDCRSKEQALSLLRRLGISDPNLRYLGEGHDGFNILLGDIYKFYSPSAEGVYYVGKGHSGVCLDAGFRIPHGEHARERCN